MKSRPRGTELPLQDHPGGSWRADIATDPLASDTLSPPGQPPQGRIPVIFLILGTMLAAVIAAAIGLPHAEGAAATDPVLAPGAGSLRLGEELPYSLYLDDTGRMNGDEVAALPDKAFTPIRGGLSLSYTRSVAWLKFTPPPRDAAGRWWLEIQPATLDAVELLEPGAVGVYHRRAGDRQAYRDRELDHRFVSFRLAASDTTTPVFLRVETSGSLYLLATLWDPDAFAPHLAANSLAWGLYFGALVVALLALFSLAWIHRRKPFLTLAVAAAVNGIHAANAQGFFAGNLWREIPRIGDFSVSVTAPWAIAATLWVLGAFFRELEEADKDPRLAGIHRFYLASALICALVPVSIPLGLYRLAMPGALLLAFAGTLLGIARLAPAGKKSGANQTFLAVLILYLVGYLGATLPLLGLIPASQELIILRNSLLILFPVVGITALFLDLRRQFLRKVSEQQQALAQSSATSARLSLDVAEQRRELAEQQQLLQQILDTSPVAIFLINEAGQLTLANRHMATMFRGDPAQLVGMAYVDLVAPSDAALAEGRLSDLLARGSAPISIVRAYQRKDGERFWGQVGLSRFEHPLSGRPELIGVIADITEQVELERFERLRNRILEMIAAGRSLTETLTAFARGIEVLRPGMICSVVLLDKSGQHLGKTIGPSLPDFYNRAIEGLAIGVGVGSCGTAAATGERVIVEDIATHPYWAPYREIAAAVGLGASWSQPITTAEGKVLGTFAIYHRRPQAPRPGDIVLIEQCAQMACIALEKESAESRLRESEALFRMLTEDISEVVWREDALRRITYINPADQRLRGFAPEEVLGRPLVDMLTEHGVTLVKEARQAGILAGTLPFRCKDGRTLWLEATAYPEKDEAGRILGYHGLARDTTARKATEDALKESRRFMQRVLDSVSSHIAVVNEAGTIVALNEAWTRFALANSPAPGVLPEHTGIGTNYLSICGGAPTLMTSCTGAPPPPGEDSAGEAREGILGVLQGRLPTFSLEYPCSSPNTERWFTMVVTPLPNEDGRVGGGGHRAYRHHRPQGGGNQDPHHGLLRQPDPAAQPPSPGRTHSAGTGIQPAQRPARRPAVSRPGQFQAPQRRIRPWSGRPVATQSGPPAARHGSGVGHRGPPGGRRIRDPAERPGGGQAGRPGPGPGRGGKNPGPAGCPLQPDRG